VKAKEALEKADTSHTQLLKIEMAVDEVSKAQERVGTELQDLKTSLGHSEARRLSHDGAIASHDGAIASHDQEFGDRIGKVESVVEKLEEDVEDKGEDIGYLAQTYCENKEVALKLQCAVDLLNKVSGQKEIDWTVGVKGS